MKSSTSRNCRTGATLIPELLKVVDGWDPGQRNMALPYMWGSVGFTYQPRHGEGTAAGCRPSEPRHDLQARECGQAGRLRHLDPRQPDRHLLMILRYLGLDPDTTNVGGLRQGGRGVQADPRIHRDLRQHQLPQRHSERRALRRSTTGRAIMPSPSRAPKRPGSTSEPRLFRAENRGAGLVRPDGRSRRMRRTSTTPTPS